MIPGVLCLDVLLERPPSPTMTLYAIPMRLIPCVCISILIRPEAAKRSGSDNQL